MSEYSTVGRPGPPNGKWGLGPEPEWRGSDTFITDLFTPRTIMEGKKKLWEKNKEGGCPGRHWSL
jgi:hypothetical protein